MSDQIFDKVTSEEDFFKKITSKIPGFKGYIERQTRRDSDKLLRDTIADGISRQEQRIATLERDMISQGNIELVDDLEASAIKLRTFADRVRRATRGYAGLFDAIKINTDELQAIYEYDAAMLDQVDEVSRAIDNVEASIGSDGLPAAMRNLRTVSQQAIDTFDRRKEVILSVLPESK
jgi:hypothetical protein